MNEGVPMMSLSRIDSAVSRLRAKALVRTLCDLAGCPPNAYRVAIWWQQHHSVEDKQLNRKWDTYFKGVTPRTSLREQMYSDFPSLRALFDNPLWLALSEDPGRGQNWDYLASGIRVGDQALMWYNSSASLLLFSRVDWPCLGLIILLLRTRSNKFLLHRKWLTLNFASFFYYACLQTPLWDCHVELHGLLTELLSHEHDLDAFRNWAADSDELEQRLALTRLLLERIQALNWLAETDAQRALLLQILLSHDIWGEALLDENGHCSGNCTCPRWLKRAWLRHCELWRSSPIMLEGYQIPAPV
jgi:hypothetical protein